ncbi:type I DNA topoisomerase [Proteiniclasticum sp. SCR006]|uniref:DNA topoisomerase 1 n=1 Tax=Proteiniclasticum aestuarii TaxID=2817862 RepID=A0A939H812_9CLOT|nr:type I DNA topoisomerase [Proteiniclasticum aestuarii]MBO1263688.1 type I DNA topoisomerase [Proteiniclasticum aestuarii]
MSQKLVIVESPAKAKTIKKYLGSGYTVEASMGHIRDLPKSQLGVNVENDFEPKYITIRGKGDLLAKLRKAAKKADKVYLATDPDREGEAISYHLSHILKLDPEENIRIEFNEITKDAVKKSIKNARPINLKVFDAQQARRIVDRLVGYEISPILWRNVKWGLSAGRVQSVALNLICNREKEIEAFETKEYWSIEADLLKQKKTIKTKLTQHKNRKIEISTEKEAEDIKKELDQGEFIVSSIKKGTKTKNPLAPFITSTLQQEASKRMNYQTRRTMSIAQKLYEGMDIKGYGSVGLITYMRTDSTRISDEAQASAKSYIESAFGKEYYPKTPRVYKGKKNAQDAHEAIRPTVIELTPEKVKDSVKAEEYKLYKLIWERFIASQMESCKLNTISLEVLNGDYKFRASGSSVAFDGFMKLYDYKNEDEEENTSIPELEENEKLKSKEIHLNQHFTQPPARYTEASFVKTLEELGIGRPSTYAPTISTLLNRLYVEREKKSLMPTDLGKIVNDIMAEYFKDIVDVEFTADMESRLDLIEEGKETWKEVVGSFYNPLKKDIDIAESKVSKITIEDEVTDEICEKCGSHFVIKNGRFGKFLACSGYPECKNTKAIVEKLDVKCPTCHEGDVIQRKSRKGKKFYGCSRYPECKYVSWYEPVKTPCPECGSLMYRRYSKKDGSYLLCSNEDCGHKIIEKKTTEEE